MFAHGNAEDLGSISEWTSAVANAIGITVFAFDYSGYGVSFCEKKFDGKQEVVPGEASVREDCDAVMDFVTRIHGFDCENVILWGRSLGASACCWMAKRVCERGGRVCGVILQSAFTSVWRVATFSTKPAPDPKYDMFDSLREIVRWNGFNAPVFVIHGTDDYIVRQWHAEEIAKAIPQELRWPPLFVRGAGHNDVENKCERYFDEVYEFISFCAQRTVLPADTSRMVAEVITESNEETPTSMIDKIQEGISAMARHATSTSTNFTDDSEEASGILSANILQPQVKEPFET